jgi:serine/threonine protein kinase
MSLEGKQLGRYRLLNLIGSGNMGEVYLADDVQLHRQVAIKVTRAEATSYPNTEAIREATRLFQREARAVALLDHPHILPLFDYGEENVNGATLTYMVMPLRQEGSLASRLQKRGGSA